MKANREAPNANDRRTAGAVYVEFLIAFLPLFVMFMSLVQLAFVQVANVVTKNAAISAARAAIVVLPDDPNEYGGVPVNSASGARRDAIVSAARARLAAVAVSPIMTLRFPSSAGGSDDHAKFAADDLVRVHIDFDYACKIPLGNLFVCRGLTKRLQAEAALPNQGAGYEYGN